MFSCETVALAWFSPELLDLPCDVEHFTRATISARNPLCPVLKERLPSAYSTSPAPQKQTYVRVCLGNYFPLESTMPTDTGAVVQPFRPVCGKQRCYHHHSNGCAGTIPFWLVQLHTYLGSRDGGSRSFQRRGRDGGGPPARQRPPPVPTGCGRTRLQSSSRV